MVNILGGEGAYRRTAGTFCVTVIQAVLFGGSETWEVTPWLEKALACFHHQTVRRMSGMGPIRQVDRTWVYTLIGAALVTVVLYEVRVYIACRQNTVAQYIVTHPIIYTCLEAERRPGVHLSRR